MTTASQTAPAAGIDERSGNADDNGDRLCLLFFAMNGAGHADTSIASTTITALGPRNRKPESA